MKTILIAIALVAITAIGVGATVSAKPAAAKHATGDAKACATMSAAECAACPDAGNCPTGGSCPAGGGGCGPCSPADAASCTR